MSAFTAAVSSALARLFEGQRAPAALRTLATYAGRILSMRSAGTADIITDDEAIGGKGGLGGRPVLVGLPGVRLDMTGGDRVRLAFEAGSPEGAEVASFEQDRAADRGAARKGDRVILGSVSYAIQVSPPLITVTFTPSGGPHGAPGLPIVLALVGSVVSPGSAAPGIPFDLVGYVATGSPEILLRRLSTEDIP